MFKSLIKFSRVITGSIVVSAGLLIASQAQASIIPCGASTCSTDFNVTIDGNAVGTGQLVYDAKTGEITLGSGVNTWTSGESTISVNSLSGNADPLIAFGLGAITRWLWFNIWFYLQSAHRFIGSDRCQFQRVIFIDQYHACRRADRTHRAGWDMWSQLMIVDTSVGGLGSLNKGVDVGNTFFFHRRSSNPEFDRFQRQ